MAPATAPARVLLLGTNVAGTITGVTTGTSIPVAMQAPGSLSIYLTSTGTGVTSGGTVLIEEADYDPDKDAPYSGTWSVISTVSASTFTGLVTIAVHVVGPVAFGFIRVRISSTITGGGAITAVARYW